MYITHPCLNFNGKLIEHRLKFWVDIESHPQESMGCDYLAMLQSKITYHQTSNISRTKSHNLNVARLVLQSYIWMINNFTAY